VLETQGQSTGYCAAGCTSYNGCTASNEVCIDIDFQGTYLCYPYSGTCGGPNGFKGYCQTCTSDNDCDIYFDCVDDLTGSGHKFCSARCDLSNSATSICPVNFTCENLNGRDDCYPNNAGQCL
jgi:hypothetical protein